MYKFNPFLKNINDLTIGEKNKLKSFVIRHIIPKIAFIEIIDEKIKGIVLLNNYIFNKDKATNSYYFDKLLIPINTSKEFLNNIKDNIIIDKQCDLNNSFYNSSFYDFNSSCLIKIVKVNADSSCNTEVLSNSIISILNELLNNLFKICPFEKTINRVKIYNNNPKRKYFKLTITNGLSFQFLKSKKQNQRKLFLDYFNTKKTKLSTNEYNKLYKIINKLGDIMNGKYNAKNIPIFKDTDSFNYLLVPSTITLNEDSVNITFFVYKDTVIGKERLVIDVSYDDLLNNNIDINNIKLIPTVHFVPLISKIVPFIEYNKSYKIDFSFKSSIVDGITLNKRLIRKISYFIKLTSNSAFIYEYFKNNFNKDILYVLRVSLFNGVVIKAYHDYLYFIDNDGLPNRNLIQFVKRYPSLLLNELNMFKFEGKNIDINHDETYLYPELMSLIKEGKSYKNYIINTLNLSNHVINLIFTKPWQAFKNRKSILCLTNHTSIEVFNNINTYYLNETIFNKKSDVLDSLSNISTSQFFVTEKVTKKNLDLLIKNEKSSYLDLIQLLHSFIQPLFIDKNKNVFMSTQGGYDRGSNKIFGKKIDNLLFLQDNNKYYEYLSTVDMAKISDLDINNNDTDIVKSKKMIPIFNSQFSLFETYNDVINSSNYYHSNMEIYEHVKNSIESAIIKYKEIENSDKTTFDCSNWNNFIGNYYNEYGKIEFITNVTDLTNEGKVMKHCVASYSNKVSSALCFIAHVTSKDNEHSTVEFVISENKIAVAQHRAECNNTPSKLNALLVQNLLNKINDEKNIDNFNKTIKLINDRKDDFYRNKKYSDLFYTSHALYYAMPYIKNILPKKFRKATLEEARAMISYDDVKYKIPYAHNNMF